MKFFTKGMTMSVEIQANGKTWKTDKETLEMLMSLKETGATDSFFVGVFLAAVKFGRIAEAK